MELIAFLRSEYGTDCVFYGFSGTQCVFMLEYFMLVLTCPYCGEMKNVIRMGVNRSKTARCKCKVCMKTFTLQPKSRKTSHEKEAQVEASILSGLSQRKIADTLQMSRTTIRQIQKNLRAKNPLTTQENDAS
jgi:transposase-like protein